MFTWGPQAIEGDPLWPYVRLLVGANETAGSVPSDLGPYSVPTTFGGTPQPVTGAATGSFTGTALVFSGGDGFLRFFRSGGFFTTPGNSFCFEVWADLSAVTLPGTYSNFRNCFAAAFDGVAGENVAVMSGAGLSVNDVSFGAAPLTAKRLSLNLGAAASEGFTRLTRNHCVVQYNSVTGRAMYYVNGYFFDDEIVGPHSRNPNVVYMGNVGDGTSYTAAGYAEWMRLTEAIRYPEVALDDGLFPAIGDKCFDPPTGPFPTS